MEDLVWEMINMAMSKSLTTDRPKLTIHMLEIFIKDYSEGSPENDNLFDINKNDRPIDQTEDVALYMSDNNDSSEFSGESGETEGSKVDSEEEMTSDDENKFLDDQEVHLLTIFLLCPPCLLCLNYTT